jgi:hypothetical protein
MKWIRLGEQEGFVRRGVVVAVLSMLLLGACGNDDGASVRSSGTGSGSGSGSASGSASGTGVASGSGSATGVASGVAGCEPVGEGRISDAEVHVELDEWSVGADTDTVPAGAIEFEITNAGEDEHELAIARGRSADALPLADDDTVDIPALEQRGLFVGEVEAFPAGGECSGVFDLDPGRYVLFCNLIHEEDSGVENHFQEGMATELVVRS